MTFSRLTEINFFHYNLSQSSICRFNGTCNVQFFFEMIKSPGQMYLHIHSIWIFFDNLKRLVLPLSRPWQYDMVQLFDKCSVPLILFAIDSSWRCPVELQSIADHNLIRLPTWMFKESFMHISKSTFIFFSESDCN